MAIARLCLYLIALANVAQPELVIQRINGVHPDRFSENEDCTTQTCSTVYGADYLVPNSCQCECPASRPTFSIQNRTCIQNLADCNDLILTDGDAEQGIFTVLISKSLHITPTLPIKSQETGELLTEAMLCTEPYIHSIEYETSEGFFATLELSNLIVETNSGNSTYLQFEGGEEISNHSSADISGLLLKIMIRCPSQNTSKCLPLTTHGFQKVKGYEETADELRSTTTQRIKSVPKNLPYIVGGTVLGVIVLAVLIVGCVIGCQPVSTEPIQDGTLKVKRVARNPSISSTRKHPIAKVIRRMSISDFRRNSQVPYDSRKKSVARTSSLRSTTTVDSGRGRSRSGSTYTYDNKAVTEAVISYESTQTKSTKGTHHQPRLFKTHQEQLSTAKQGIVSVPAQTHKEKASSTGKHLSPFKRLFSRKGQHGSPASGSQLSIDFDQFSVHDAPPSLTGKRFSENIINPGISFNTEGRLAQTEEVQIEVPVTSNLQFVENDFYDKSDTPYSLNNGLPVTSIDDVSDDTLECYQLYEQVNTKSIGSLDDFVAI